MQLFFESAVFKLFKMCCEVRTYLTVLHYYFTSNNLYNIGQKRMNENNNQNELFLVVFN